MKGGKFVRKPILMVSISSCKKEIIPYEQMPDFHIFLVPKDKNIPEMVTIAGNSENYDFSSVKKDMSVMDIQDDNDSELKTMMKLKIIMKIIFNLHQLMMT